MSKQTPYRGTKNVGALALLSATTLFSMPSSLLWAAQVFQESGGRVVIEAEHADTLIPRNNQSWELYASRVGYTGTGYLKAMPNLNVDYTSGYLDSSPEAVYTVNFTTTGTYHVWIRAFKTDGSANRIHAGIDGMAPSSGRNITNFYYNKWYWSDGSRTLTVSTPGLHTIHVWMGQDGLEFDRVVLTTASSPTPSTSWPESPRAASGPTPDTQPPIGSITINNGSAMTNNVSVSLTLSATDNSGTIDQMQFSNDGANYSTPEAYVTSKTLTLTTGDGTKTVYVKFSDLSGNWSSAFSDTIELDTTPPQLTISSQADGSIIYP